MGYQNSLRRTSDLQSAFLSKWLGLPHDNGLIATGFRRYGFANEASCLAHDVIDAARHFRHHQIPELYAGLQRNAMDSPVQYLGPNVPQAWAAGSTFMFLRTILGLVPDAPREKLYVDPFLPDWLCDVILIDLHVVKHRFDLRFWRSGSESRYEVLRGDSRAVIQRSFATGLAI